MNISLAAEPLFHIGNFPLTNTLFVTWGIILIFIAAIFKLRRLKEIPRGLQNIIEIIFEKLLGFIDSVTGDRKQSIRFFPIVVTIFLFVLFSNLVEILPGLGTIGFKEMHHGQETIIPFLRSSSADLNVTIAIAIISVFSTQILGIVIVGAAKYAKRFFVAPWHKPFIVGTFIGLLELVAELAKIISFSFRLFGNIFAGEILLTVMLFLVPYIIPLPFLLLEIFVGFIQALIFSTLTLVFSKIAVTAHEGGH